MAKRPSNHQKLAFPVSIILKTALVLCTLELLDSSTSNANAEYLTKLEKHAVHNMLHTIFLYQKWNLIYLKNKQKDTLGYDKGFVGI